MILSAQRAFTDIIKSLELRSLWLRVGSKSNQHLYKRTEVSRPRGEGDGTMAGRAGGDDMSTARGTPSIAGNPLGERHTQASSLEPSEP